MSGRVRASAAPAGEVRIIGGRWRRSRLPVGAAPGLRPTPDRVRETLFNWLGQDLSGCRCVDAFAGSGALGFEAASRGAAEVVLIERDAALQRALRANVERLGGQPVLRVVGGDALVAMAALPAGAWDVVFLDPPFDDVRAGGEHLTRAALQAALRLLRPGGWGYLESPRAWSEAELATLGWTLHRHLRAGAVHAHLLRRDDNHAP
ncbi:16S rRNA (guanine(966)-N(2))-methyltransferase RsmD [Tepidimonas taiwanensis]|uniref:Ribosomal RNA small subunit methyltransferase D n=1 Tax=Tepidimonas taiwanensis TaxID=307486 RepID=A0A554X595_9BURK|nr:16S rRNA (guanine(966)-N(2))-methyltransferase RsmD [Tepidimonas taiwanensis]MCX7692626.1 16S rRNA (guanine(966)-N(2))-methyltransferase RsmD [Tepidimonas taiwanensis]MDM7464164.1 16S rRNA (guanine(966)-N(2))-methyltransferase RsmD [Tepidimonas taiwanensis]TSE30926.1 Ribosomal RNA small subunit methyltransferase D [Tepidimonas taiwanensis]UBQ05860.1 16S rRNA (guanine(966)-N(2))-methyltransferase RsmD [Tepidimonas taiwanensis]